MLLTANPVVRNFLAVSAKFLGVDGPIELLAENIAEICAEPPAACC